MNKCDWIKETVWEKSTKVSDCVKRALVRETTKRPWVMLIELQSSDRGWCSQDNSPDVEWMNEALCKSSKRRKRSQSYWESVARQKLLFPNCLHSIWQNLIKKMNGQKCQDSGVQICQTSQNARSCNCTQGHCAKKWCRWVKKNHPTNTVCLSV